MSTAYLVTKREIVLALTPYVCWLVGIGFASILWACLSDFSFALKVSIGWRVAVLAICIATYCIGQLITIRLLNSRRLKAMRVLHDNAIVTLKIIPKTRGISVELNPQNDPWGFQRAKFVVPAQIDKCLVGIIQAGPIECIFLFIASVITLIWYAVSDPVVYFCINWMICGVVSLLSCVAYGAYVPGRILLTNVGLLVEEGVRATVYPWSAIEFTEWKDRTQTFVHLEGTLAMPACFRVKVVRKSYWTRQTIDFAVEMPNENVRAKLIETVSYYSVLKVNSPKVDEP